MMKKYSSDSGKRTLTRARLANRITRRNRPMYQSLSDIVSSCPMTEKFETTSVNSDSPSSASSSGRNHSKKVERNIGAWTRRNGLSFCAGSRDRFVMSTEAIFTSAEKLEGWFRKASMTSGLRVAADEACSRRPAEDPEKSRCSTLRTLSEKEVMNSSRILIELFGLATSRYLKSSSALRSWIRTVSESSK